MWVLFLFSVKRKMNQYLKVKLKKWQRSQTTEKDLGSRGAAAVCVCVCV